MVSVDSNGNRKWYAISQVKLYEEPEIEPGKSVEDKGTALGPWSIRHWKEKTGNGGPEECPVPITEVIVKGDLRYEKSKMKDAIQKDIEKLLKRGNSKIVLCEEIPHDSKILGGRFILAI